MRLGGQRLRACCEVASAKRATSGRDRGSRAHSGLPLMLAVWAGRLGLLGWRCIPTGPRPLATKATSRCCSGIAIRTTACCKAWRGCLPPCRGVAWLSLYAIKAVTVRCCRLLAQCLDYTITARPSAASLVQQLSTTMALALDMESPLHDHPDDDVEETHI